MALAGAGVTAASSRPMVITAVRFAQALAAAGVIDDDGAVRRVVIDAEAGCVVRVYVERYGDERLLKIAHTLDGVEISGAPAAKRHPVRYWVLSDKDLMADQPMEWPEGLRPVERGAMTFAGKHRYLFEDDTASPELEGCEVGLIFTRHDDGHVTWIATTDLTAAGGSLGSHPG